MTTPKPRPSAHNGTKWVDLNYDAKENAKKLNGGFLPPSPALFTSDFPNKDVWSTEYLPEVLFFLERPENAELGVKPETIVRDDNVVLRKFDVLPDYISVDVEGWLVHTWRCLDSRIMLQDISDRMVEDLNYFGQKLKKPPSNALSNHSYRGCRKILGSYNDYARRDQPHRATVESLEKLSFEKVWMNTVLPRSIEFPDRLVRVKFVRKGVDATGQYEARPVEVTKQNYLETTFPLDHFCLRKFDPCVVSQLEYDLMPALSILFDLQKKAELHELGHWRDLPKECLPESWFDRTRDGAPEKPNYDGGCNICTWRPGVDAPSPTAQAFNFDYLRQRSAEKSAGFDREKAFQHAGKSKDVVLKHEVSLKRPRSASIEPDVQRSITPAPRSATELQHPGSAPAALRTKRIKMRNSKRSTKDVALLEEDPTVSELPLAAPLQKGTRYKIKYLEKDDQYNGFWETDTEVEPESDTETMVDHNAGALVPSKDLAKRLDLPSSPPKTPVEAHLGNAFGLSEAVTDLTGNHDILQATGFFPVDFLSSHHSGDNLAGARGHNSAFMANTPPEDPFSSFTSTSTSNPFHPEGLWEPWQFDDFHTQQRKANFTPAQIRRQSMDDLLRHSAALHNIMGLDHAQHSMSTFPNQYLGDNSAIPNSQLQTVHPSVAGMPQLPLDSATSKAMIQSQGPKTPAKVRGGDFGNLLFTDETNRFTGLGNQFEASAPRESPLKNYGHGSASSVYMPPMSPVRATAETVDRRIFTVNEDEHSER